LFEKGFYDTMDAGFKDEHGYVCVMARDDDVINVAGHRLSTSALEEAILEHTDVIDCAVVGVPDELKGEVPLALFVEKTREFIFNVIYLLDPKF
jgi:propionyl-CoA synthetase